MTATTMANAVSTLQNRIVNLLKADTTSLSFSVDGETATQTSTLSEMKIVDGVPSKQIKEGGFPLIIVHTPEESSTRLTMTRFKREFTIHIEILDRREGNVRVLTDGVIDCLHNNQASTKEDSYWWFGRKITTNINYTYLTNDIGGKPVWHMDIFLTYLWTGERQ